MRGAGGMHVRQIFSPGRGQKTWEKVKKVGGQGHFSGFLAVTSEIVPRHPVLGCFFERASQRGSNALSIWLWLFWNDVKNLSKFWKSRISSTQIQLAITFKRLVRSGRMDAFWNPQLLEI